jgi:predicted Zn-dependent protease
MKQRRLSTAILLVLVSSASVAAFSLVSVDQEIAIGRQAQQQVRSQVSEVTDRDVTGYVEAIGRRLAAQAPGPEYPYSFSVANYQEVNAFALPGGPVWVHRGILDLAQNEAQVASVIAHEIAHIAERHTAEQLTRATVANGLLGLLGAVLDGGKGEAVARIGAGLGTQLMFLKFSRDHEREADRVGMQIMQRAGWDTRGMVQFFDLLEAQQKRSPSSVQVFLSTHPAPGERADELRGRAQPGGRMTSGEFREVKQELNGLPPAQRMARR